MNKRKGISIHVGLNRIDSSHYGTDGALAGCENDARSMQEIASELGYETSVLLSEQATAAALLDAVRSAASQLESGDVLLLTYAGHGAQVPDDTEEEFDGQDETWCVYDRMIIDDELYSLWSELKPGVLAIVVSDSCHSGTVARKRLGTPSRSNAPEPRVVRQLPWTIASQAFDSHRELYLDVLEHVPRTSLADVDAPLILLSACKENQLSSDGEVNGLFTEKLLSVWNRGAFGGTYPEFTDAIVRQMPRPSEQTPTLESSDRASSWLGSRPFQIPAPAKTNGVAHPQPATSSVDMPVASCAMPQIPPTCHQLSNYEVTQMETFIDNGNWAEVAPIFAAEVQSKRGGSSFIDQVIAANAHSAEVAYAGTGSYGAAPESAYAPVANRGGSVFRAFWWGFHVQLSRDDLQYLYTVSDPNGEFVRRLRVTIPRDYQYWVDIIAAFVKIAVAVIRAADRGRGVYISMSWFAPGAFVPTPV